MSSSPHTKHRQVSANIEQARMQLGRKLGETERETNRVMNEYESHLGALDVKYKVEIERGRARMESVMRENEKLRQMIGESAARR